MDDFSVDFGDATDGAAGVAEDGKSRSGMTEQLLVVMLKLVIGAWRVSRHCALMAQAMKLAHPGCVTPCLQLSGT